MLKFFRRIRKKLFFENKTGKYLLYALGEISLIIIGVLIALTVSEWNKNKKDRAYEREMLTLIKTDIENELKSLTDIIPRLDDRIARVAKLDSLLKGPPPPYEKSLDTLFGAVWGLNGYSFEISQYENLKSTGLNLIRESDLRDQLIIVFEEVHPSLEFLMESEVGHNIEIYRKYYLSNFHPFRFRISATPIDYQKTWRDKYYQNIVYYRLQVLNNPKGGYNRAVTEMSTLVKMIDEYLE